MFRCRGACVCGDADAVSAHSDEKSDNSRLVLTEHLGGSWRYGLTVTGLQSLFFFLLLLLRFLFFFSPRQLKKKPKKPHQHGEKKTVKPLGTPLA